MNPNRRKVPLYLQLIIAMFLGVGVGLYFGREITPLGEIGRLVIQVIKAIAAPLLFLTIIQGILKTNVELKNLIRMFGIVAVNALIALVISISLSNWIKPGALMKETLAMERSTPESAEQSSSSLPPVTRVEGQLHPLKILDSYIPKSLVEPFAQNSAISLVLLALLIGFGLKAIREEKRKNTDYPHRAFEAVEDLVTVLLSLMEKILKWIIALVPLAVFGVVARSIGQYGLAPIKGLAVYLGVTLFGLFLHVVVTYQAWIYFYAKMSLRRFWSNARDAVVYALGANSSLATLPITLNSLDKMGVSKDSATLGACVGTNLNHDGIILYELMAVFFVAQSHGIHLTLTQQAVAAVSCVIAGIGIAGVPESGFISLALVLGTVGLPTESLPLLLTVDWIVARARSATNVLNEMTTSIALDRWSHGPDRFI